MRIFGNGGAASICDRRWRHVLPQIIPHAPCLHHGKDQQGRCNGLEAGNRSPCGKTGGIPMDTLISKYRKGLLGLGVAACAVAALPVWADDDAQQTSGASRQANIGVVTGLAVGAAAGGPPGAIIGAAAGAWLGDSYHRQKQTSGTLAENLGRSEAERTRLRGDVTRLSGSLEQAKAHAGQLEQSLSATDEIGMDVNFRTDDSAIRAAAVTPLLKLGALAASMPGVKVQVVGYADPRGSAAYNLLLSQRRAQAVATVLGCTGLPSDRVVVEARGAAATAGSAGDADDFALERRVTVRLMLPAAPQPLAVSGATHPAADSGASGG
jgi:outer membrane protein OmpA-like peptidoglycan-associated protein